MKLVTVTPYNTSNGTPETQQVRGDIASAAPTTFSYKLDTGFLGTGGETITLPATLLTFNNGSTMTVKETLAELVAAS